MENLIKSFKIPNSIAINKLVIDDTGSKKITPKTPTNIIFCCDVSGSMYGSLTQMRKQLKNRIPDLVSEGDTITIIWFSGRNQAGILKEEVYVKNVNDLQKLNEAIDRYLTPQGLTSFLDPIILAGQAIDRMITNRKDSVFSFIFLTDGYNNDSSWTSIMENLAKLESKVSSSAFIEYGYYANSQALTEMAEVLGGEKIFSQNFESYEIEFEKKVKGKVSTRKEINIEDLRKKLMYGFMFTISGDTILVYAVENKEKIFVPEDTTELYFFSQKGFADGEKLKSLDDTILYASAYVLGDRLKYKNVEDILAHLGDKFLLQNYASAYGKQKLNVFKETVKSMVFDTNLRFPEGRQEGFTPDPTQYCVMNLIEDLMEDGNEFYPYHPDFNYERIGAKSVTKTVLDDAQLDALSKAKTKAQADAIMNTVEAPEFVYPDNAAEIGSPLSQLVWNEKRANLSVNTKLNGTVKLPKNDFGLKEVESYIYRAYTFIKDGVLNVTSIPVSLNEETFNKLYSLGLIEDTNEVGDYLEGNIYTLDFSSLPTINKKMVTSVSAKSLAKLEYELIKTQAKAKYLKELTNTFAPKTNTVSAKLYSPEAAEWLKSIGVTDYNGFSPKRELIKSGDFYMASTLETKVAGLSKLPKVSDAIAKMKEIEDAENDQDTSTPTKVKPANVSTQLLIDVIQEVKILPTDSVTPAKAEEIKVQNKQVDKIRRSLLAQIAQIKFGIILSRTWFKEFTDFSETTLDLKIGKEEVKFTFDYEDTQVNI